MKLWDKGFSIDERIDRFTVGKDRELDLSLAPHDIVGTIAHITMLEKVGLLAADELQPLLKELRDLYRKAREGGFVIEPDIEDVHSQVELELTRRLGDVGKKVHTGRSRNDQVMVDVKLFAREEIEKTVDKVERLFTLLQQKSEQYREVLMPGYTHLQVAMPSSFGLWFGAWAETLADDLQLMVAAWRLANLNPLGSAAGYGSSAPLDRTLTTRLLGFDDLDYNVVCAQMSRGKFERAVAFAYAAIAETLGRMAADCCLFNSQNFGFVRLPKELTTGSSIMPRNKLNAVPETIRLITTNLPSGYFRDMQIIKEVFVPLFAEMDDCLDIAAFAVENMTVADHLMDDPRYQTAFSVEGVNRLVAEGVPFRDAYRQVGMAIEQGTFSFDGTLCHTHEGSIGNPCNEQIRTKMERTISAFDFAAVHAALDQLIG